LNPSVVNINTESTIKAPRRRRGQAPANPDESPFDDFFDRFFGGQGGGGDSGGDLHQTFARIWRDRRWQGYIVTNRHVVEKADRIRVRFAG